jgi:hypothetical protein
MSSSALSSGMVAMPNGPEAPLFSDNHLGRLATTILAGGEDRREGVARAEV